MERKKMENIIGCIDLAAFVFIGLLFSWLLALAIFVLVCTRSYSIALSEQHHKKQNKELEKRIITIEKFLRLEPGVYYGGIKSKDEVYVSDKYFGKGGQH
jgi:hypothetical protein